MDADLTALQNTHSLLAKQCQSYENTIDRLSDQLGLGAYNAETTRVLSLMDNPASKDLAVRTELLDSLKAENQALLRRLSAESRDEVEMVPKATSDGQLLRIAKLEEEMAQKTTASQRLRDVRLLFCEPPTELRSCIDVSNESNRVQGSGRKSARLLCRFERGRLVSSHLVFRTVIVASPHVRVDAERSRSRSIQT